MRQASHIFRNPHPGIAVVLFAGTAGLTAVFNFFFAASEINQVSRWLVPACTGLAAWFINVVLVYRSGYLSRNYVLGWYWFVLLMATHPNGISLGSVGTSVIVSVWLAMAYELGDERKNGLIARTNLGLYSASLGLFSLAWWSAVFPALWALRNENPRQSAKIYGQIVAAWAIGVTIFFLILGLTNQSIGSYFVPLNSFWGVNEWPSLGWWVIGIWLVLALGETFRAQTSAKKAKRRGLMLSWIGILWALSLYTWQGPESNAAAILVVFAAPHMVNLQSYMKKSWMIRLLDISLLAAAFSSSFWGGQ
ncbi:MAG: hypothetical protein P8N56_00855 [Schleiferiaceae bacterium]|nr:hypothetical protein [Schleiferiaceae bacterium]